MLQILQCWWPCSNDITNGVRASAHAVVAMEQGVKNSAQLARLAVEKAIIPSLRAKVPLARGKLCVWNVAVSNSGKKHQSYC